jgi:pSer/pThr/pTyr-binding forkhead associated (FHA) protein
MRQLVKNLDRRQSLRGPHFQHRLPQVSLEIVRGAAQRRMRLVRPPVYLIGAAGDCDLVLGDPAFPAVHTYLYVTATGVSVRHIGEGPKLYVNGVAIETARLANGDRLRLGAYEFVVHVHDCPTKDEGVTVAARDEDTPEAEYDADWEHLQLLLCDLPTSIRPQAIPAWRVIQPAAEAPYPRRAIA